MNPDWIFDRAEESVRTALGQSLRKSGIRALSAEIVCDVERTMGS